MSDLLKNLWSDPTHPMELDSRIIAAGLLVAATHACIHIHMRAKTEHALKIAGDTLEKLEEMAIKMDRMDRSQLWLNIAEYFEFIIGDTFEPKDMIHALDIIVKDD